MEDYDLDWNSTSNFTNATLRPPLPCSIRRLLGGPSPFSQTTADAFRYIQAILFIVGFPIGLFLNTLVIVLVATVKKLHQTTFYLALQVVVVDLLITLIQFPTTTANVIANRWVYGAVGCPTIGFFLFTFRNMRNFLMFVFVTDRTLTVFAPYWYYRRYHRNAVVVPLSIAAWLFAVVYGLVPMPFALDCHEYGTIAWGCTVSKGCKYPEICDGYKNASVVLSNVIGGLIPLVMYIVLYCKARQLKRKLCIPRHALSDVTLDSSFNGLSSTDIKASRKQSVISSGSISNQSSIANTRKISEQRRKRDETANITFAILFIALIGVSFPSTIFFVIGTSAFSAMKIRPPETFVIISTIFRTFFNFLVIIDPIAIMRNRDVKIAFQECYRHLKLRIRGGSQPIHAINYTARKNSATTQASVSVRLFEGTGNCNGCSVKFEIDVNGTNGNDKCADVTEDGQQRGEEVGSSEHTSSVQRKASVSFEIVGNSQ